MWKSWFIDHPLTPLSIGAMAFFIGTFLVVLLRVLRSDSAVLNERARLPLLDPPSSSGTPTAPQGDASHVC